MRAPVRALGHAAARGCAAHSHRDAWPSCSPPLPKPSCARRVAVPPVAHTSWLPSYAKGLLVGTPRKWLRIYDLRQRDCASAIIAHESNSPVLGLDFDPHQDFLFATYSDDRTGIVKVRELSHARPGLPGAAVAPGGSRLLGSAREHVGGAA